MKDELDLRPLWHKCDINIEGHVLLGVCSYLLFKMLDTYLLKKSIATTPERALQAIKEIRAVGIDNKDRYQWKLMKIPKDTLKILDAVGIGNSKKIFHQWAENALAYEYNPRLWNTQKHRLKNRGKNHSS